MVELTPQELQTWLEWAGARLIAMPGGRTRPAEPHVIWPEYSQNKAEVLDFRGALSIRAAAPSKLEIPILDEILILPNTCTNPITRRIVHARSLVHPLNGRYLYNWTRIARLLKSDRRAVKRLHERGLVEIVEKADRARVCRIAAFFSTSEANPTSCSLRA